MRNIAACFLFDPLALPAPGPRPSRAFGRIVHVCSASVVFPATCSTQKGCTPSCVKASKQHHDAHRLSTQQFFGPVLSGVYCCPGVDVRTPAVLPPRHPRLGQPHGQPAGDASTAGDSTHQSWVGDTDRLGPFAFLGPTAAGACRGYRRPCAKFMLCTHGPCGNVLARGASMGWAWSL